MYNEMSVMLISVSHDTVVSNKHEERTRHYYVIFPTVIPSDLMEIRWNLPVVGTLRSKKERYQNLQMARQASDWQGHRTNKY